MNTAKRICLDVSNKKIELSCLWVKIANKNQHLKTLYHERVIIQKRETVDEKLLLLL